MQQDRVETKARRTRDTSADAVSSPMQDTTIWVADAFSCVPIGVRPAPSSWRLRAVDDEESRGLVDP